MLHLPLVLSMLSAAQDATGPAAGEERCGEILTRIAEAGTHRGYSVSPGTIEFIGTRGRAALGARCSAGHVEIALVEANGSAVNIDFVGRAEASFALRLVGEFPDLGTVSRTAIIDAGALPFAGSIRFTAETGGDSTFVEYDLASEILAIGGVTPGNDSQRFNTSFAPALSASTIWKDAHALGYAAAGIWDSALADHESELDIMLGLAIPSPDPRAKVDSDSKDAVQKCGVAFTICLAAAWLPPAGAWACGGALGTCIAALPCLPGDCAGDGV